MYTQQAAVAQIGFIWPYVTPMWFYFFFLMAVWRALNTWNQIFSSCYLGYFRMESDLGHILKDNVNIHRIRIKEKKQNLALRLAVWTLCKFSCTTKVFFFFPQSNWFCSHFPGHCWYRVFFISLQLLIREMSTLVKEICSSATVYSLNNTNKI